MTGGKFSNPIGREQRPSIVEHRYTLSAVFPLPIPLVTFHASCVLQLQAMKSIITIFLSLTLPSILFAQKDYEVVLEFKQGFTLIKKYSGREYRYGLLENSTGKVILPMQYSLVSESFDDELFLVKDTADKVGVFSPKKGMVVTPVYREIRPYLQGFAVAIEGRGGLSDRFGVIDKLGKTVIPFTYEYLGNYRDGLFNYRENSRYGFIDIKNNVVIPATYRTSSDFSDGLAPAHDEAGNYGFIDKSGQWKIAPKYAMTDNFFDGYAKVYSVKRNNSRSGTPVFADTVGIINGEGKLIIPMQYNYISHKQHGLFRVDKGSQSGLVDSTGRIVFPLEYQTIAYAAGGFHLVTRSKKGLVDRSGKVVLPFEYDYLWILDDGSVITRKDALWGLLDNKLKTLVAPDSAATMLSSRKYIMAVRNGKVSVYDRQGRLLKSIKEPFLITAYTNFNKTFDSVKIKVGKDIKLFDLATGKFERLPYSDIGDFSKEGIAVARTQAGGYHFLKPDGSQLNTNPFYNVVSFTEGICGIQESSTVAPYLANTALVRTGDLTTVFEGPFSEGLAKSRSQYSPTLFYIIDKTGKSVFSVSAKDVYPFREGRCRAVTTTGRVMFYDRSGKLVTGEAFNNALDFSEGYAAVQIGTRWGFIDTSGNFTIPAKFDAVSSFYKGIAIARSGNDYFLITSTGDRFDAQTFEGAGTPANGSFPVKKNSKVGLIDQKGRTTIAFKYDNILPLSDGLTWALKDKKWGLVDKDGIELTGFIYDNVGELSHGYFQVVTGGKIGLINKKGKLVLPAQYDQMSSVHSNRIIAITGEREYSVALP